MREIPAKISHSVRNDTCYIMNDYRLVQIEELNKKIEDTKLLLADPSLAELAQEEIADLELQKKVIEDTLTTAEDSQNDDLDSRNVILEVKGAAGGDEANLFAQDLLRMYTRFSQLKGLKVEPVAETVIKISGRNAFWHAQIRIRGAPSATHSQDGKTRPYSHLNSDSFRLA
jgi:protein subunit release factor A